MPLPPPPPQKKLKCGKRGKETRRKKDAEHSVKKYRIIFSRAPQPQEKQEESDGDVGDAAVFFGMKKIESYKQVFFPSTYFFTVVVFWCCWYRKGLVVPPPVSVMVSVASTTMVMMMLLLLSLSLLLLLSLSPPVQPRDQE